MYIPWKFHPPKNLPFSLILSHEHLVLFSDFLENPIPIYPTLKNTFSWFHSCLRIFFHQMDCIIEWASFILKIDLMERASGLLFWQLFRTTCTVVWGRSSVQARMYSRNQLCRYQFDRLPSPPGNPGAFAPKCVPSPRAFAQQKMPGGRANKWRCPWGRAFASTYSVNTVIWA